MTDTKIKLKHQTLDANLLAQLGSGLGWQLMVTLRVKVLNALMALFVILPTSAFSSDVNVLFLGSNKANSNQLIGITANTFLLESVSTEFENILSQANKGTVDVDFEDLDVYVANGGTQYAFETDEGNLVLYRHSIPFAERDTVRLPLLRGETKSYDYVVITDDPTNMEHLPGLYAQGVKTVVEEIRKSGAEPILLMTWPGATSLSTVAHYKEVVYRTAKGLNLRVVPAALAWEDAGAIHGDTHPTDDGAYIAAASVYAQIYNESASKSNYNPAKHSLADGAKDIVDENLNTEYSGIYHWDGNPLKSLFLPYRAWSISSAGKSTEGTFAEQAKNLGAKEYNRFLHNVDGESISMPNGIRHTRITGNTTGGFALNYFFAHPGNSSISNETLAGRLGGALMWGHLYRYTVSPTAGRYLPISLLWMEIIKEFPNAAFMHSGHIGPIATRATSAFHITQLTGKCPLGPKPNPVDENWWATKVGYELAWTMSTLQARAPGFKAIPSASRRMTVDAQVPETMESFFVLSPQEDVTVTVSTDQPWATVTPQTITFTPGNYDSVQEITVTVDAGAPRGSTFNVIYETASTDDVCNALRETWEYAVNSLPLADPQTVIAFPAEETLIVLTATHADLLQSLSYSITEAPTNGTVTIVDNRAVYFPNANFMGSDSFKFVANDGLVTGVEGTINIDVNGGGIFDYNLIANPNAEFTPLNDYYWNGSWETVSDTEGNYFKAPDGTVGETYESYQDVNVSGFSAFINAGIQSFQLDYRAQASDEDCHFVMEYRDSNGMVLGGYDSDRLQSTKGRWFAKTATNLVPANTAVIRVILRSKYTNGYQGHSASFDDLSLMALVPANSAPVAVDPPTASIAMDVPTAILLAGTDIDDNELTYIVVGAPTNGVITGWDGAMPIYTPDAGYQGPDSFTFKANDGDVDSANVATANITVRPNEAPSIVLKSPTIDHVYFTLTNGIVIDTTVTDDGGPVNPGTVSLSWSQVSGPSATIESPTSEDTAIEWAEFIPGTYVFRLTADDGELSTTKDVTVTVTGDYESPDNIAPQVGMGGPYNGIFGAAIELNGIILTDDAAPADPGVTIYRWQKLSGPGTATFSDATDLKSTVVFSVRGTYVLRLIGNDGQIMAYKDVSVVVSGNSPPTANIGNVQTVTDSDDNGSESVNLDGSASADADGPVTYIWREGVTQIATGVSPTVVLDVGIHTITLTVTDNEGATDTATVIVRVNAVQIVIVAVADAYVSGSSLGNINYGSSTALAVRHDSNKAKFVHRSYVRFELPTLPATTESVKLRLYQETSAAGSSDIRVKLVDDDTWQETTITSNNAPSPTGDYLATWSPVEGTFVELDITTAVQQQTDGELSLYIDTAGNYLNTIASREAIDESRRPTLVVTTTLSPVNIPPTAVAGSSQTLTDSDDNGSESVTLNGSGSSDTDGSISTYVWSEGGTQIATGVSPTVDLGVGTHTITLTVTDDDGATATDTITITVNPPLPAAYASWAASTFANTFMDMGLESNPEGDQSNNFMEFAFGTDPTLSDSGPLAIDGSINGLPILQAAGASSFEFYFIRRVDHGTSGSLTYTPQFSSDLNGFTDSTDPITVVTVPSVNSDYEIVKVPFPAGTNFGRIKVVVVP
jgi:hypothetical protein